MLQALKTVGFLSLLACLLVSIAPAAHAVSVPFVPSDLNIGDTYHVAFITNDGRTAASSLMADYNMFVQNQAELAGAETENWGVSWFAIASVPGTSAEENIPVSDSPIYLLTDIRLADDAADLWDGAIQTSFSVNQFGLTESGQEVWTGTDTDGSPSLSAAPLGSGTPATGLSDSVDSSWVNDGFRLGTNPLALYAVSEVLTVIPEPGTALLLGLGLTGLGLTGPRGGERRTSRPRRLGHTLH